MSKEIFASTAPDYWNAGLPVIPLWPQQKNPSIGEWSQFCARMPTDAEQIDWLNRFASGNIGLPLGPASGLIAFDVDTEDQQFLKIIEAMMPVTSPWRRVGKKGYVCLFRYSGEKTFQIKDLEGKVICELLSNGRQVVLPPSIHPNTKLPYTANTPLLDVLHSIPALLPNFENTLRAAFTQNKVKLSVSGFSRITEYVPKSSRDVRYTSICGMFARDVLRGTIKLVDAINGVEAWPSSFTEHVDGDDVDPKDGVKKLVRFLIKNVREDGMTLPKGWDDGLSEADKASIGINFNEDETERCFAEILSLMEAELDGTDSQESKQTVVKKTITRIHRSPSLTNTEVETLLRNLSALSGLRLSIASLRNDLKEMKQGGLEGLSHAEIAQHLVDNLPDLRFHQGKLWTWEGSYWIEKEQHELLSTIIRDYGNLPSCRKQGDYVAVSKTFQTLVTRPLADINAIGINFANGFLLNNLELQVHRPEYGMTYRLPYRYLPEKAGQCPKFFQFLNDAWGKDKDFDEKKFFLQEAIAATLFGMGTKLCRAVLLKGVANGGKSVLIRIMTGLVPDNLTSAVGPEMWGDKYAPAEMVGKLVNLAGELSETKNIDGKIFKEIVDGATITAQRKQQQLFKYTPICMHWFASNYYPKSQDISEGFYRRWAILGFHNPRPDHLKNLNLPEEILAEEREAIVAWAVPAITRLLKNNHYTLPPSHLEAIKELMASSGDQIVRFLQGGSVMVAPTHETPETGKGGASILNTLSAMMVYGEYQKFCVAQSARPVSLPTFLGRMEQIATSLGFKVATTLNEIGLPVVSFSGLTMRVVQKGGRER